MCKFRNKWAAYRTKPRPVMVLRTDALNMELLRLLMTRYTVVIEEKDNETIIELYQT